MVSQSYGTVPIMLFYLVLTVIVCKSSPYKGNKKNYRPVANYLIMMVIAGIIMGIATTDDP